jgi:hypothetical protein
MNFNLKELAFEVKSKVGQLSGWFLGFISVIFPKTKTIERVVRYNHNSQINRNNDKINHRIIDSFMKTTGSCVFSKQQKKPVFAILIPFRKQTGTGFFHKYK